MKDAFSLTGAAAAALAFLCVGCGGSNPVDTSTEASKLTRGRAAWVAAGVSHYSFTVQRSCFCTPEVTRAVRVEVDNGTVKSLTYADDGKPADPNLFSAFDTIEELFTQIESAISRNATLNNVSYDPTLGYLTTANIDWIPQAADDEVSYTVSNFTRL